jgi:hypothetical protein
MRFLVLTATYKLRVSRKGHLRDHPSGIPFQGRKSNPGLPYSTITHYYLSYAAPSV